MVNNFLFLSPCKYLVKLSKKEFYIYLFTHPDVYTLLVYKTIKKKKNKKIMEVKIFTKQMFMEFTFHKVKS